MTWAKLLAAVDGGSGSEAVVRAALALGQTFDARVELLHVEVPEEDAIPVVAEGMAAGALEQLVEGMREQREERVKVAEALHKKLCLDAGLPTVEPDAPPAPGSFRVAFRRVVGREADEVAARGRLADLVIVAGATAEADDGYSPALEAAIFETGGPLIMVPESVSGTQGRRIAIAWDGTLGAARSAAAALPLLRRAEKVVVMTADMEKTGAKPSELADFLAEHGIAAETWAFLPKDGPLGELILSEAEEAGADMLAMGAYGHSRLREMVLGGVTRSIIARARIPVFMAH